MQKINQLEIMRMLKNRYPKTYQKLLIRNAKNPNKRKSSDAE